MSSRKNLGHFLTFWRLYDNGTYTMRLNLKHSIQKAQNKWAKKHGLRPFTFYDPLQSMDGMDFVLSGFPQTQRNRKVYIYHERELIHTRARHSHASLPWVALFTPSGHPEEMQWVDPLMGWVGTSDPMEQYQLETEFPTKEDAITWARKNGFRAEVQDDQEMKKDHKSYADKFVYRAEQADW